jgi:hypothetical protein
MPVSIPNAKHFWIEQNTHLGFWLSDQAEEAQGLAVAFFRKHLRNA